MSGFDKIDTLIQLAKFQGKLQRIAFSKVMASVGVANSPHTLWNASGYPSAGTSGTNGAANARVLTKSSAGAIPWLNDAASGETSHVVGLGATSITASATGTLILCDRIADCNVSFPGSVAYPLTFSPNIDGTSRMAATTAPGDGGQIWTEVTTAGSAFSDNINYTYTDQLGVGSKTSALPSSVVSCAVNRPAWTFGAALVGQNQLWFPLDGVSTGVRSIQSSNNSSSNQTGAFNVCIVRPLAHLPLFAVSQYVERDYAVEIPNLPQVWAGACLFFIFVPTAAVTATIFGELKLCSN